MLLCAMAAVRHSVKKRGQTVACARVPLEGMWGMMGHGDDHHVAIEGRWLMRSLKVHAHLRGELAHH